MREKQEEKEEEEDFDIIINPLSTVGDKQMTDQGAENEIEIKEKE